VVTATRVGAWGLLLVAVAGCGDGGALWARYRAERDFWHARRMVQEMQIEPRLTTDADFGRAIVSFREIATRFPAERWAAPERLRDPVARDVAILSGDALIAIGQLEEMRGDRAAALAEYERAGRAYRAVIPVALRAALAHAAAMERSDPVQAAAEYAAIARDFPLLDPHSGEALIPVLDASFRAAAAQRQRGLAGAADSTLAALEQRALEVVPKAKGRTAAELWVRIAQARAGRLGAEPDPALEALRQALAEAGGGDFAARILLSMGEISLAAGRADSALVFARRGFDIASPSARGVIGLFEGRVWEQRGQADSAIAHYQRLAAVLPPASTPALEARLRHALLLEETGHWEQARSELRALAATAPSHPVAIAALEGIVGHHLRRGEIEFAAVESRSALEHLDRLIATYRDEDVLLRARVSRAGLLLAVGRFEAALPALVEVWERYSGTPQGIQAGVLAAQVAEGRLNDRPRALQLYRDLAVRSPDPQVQAAARAQIRRLEGGATERP